MNIETILKHLATREPGIMGRENFKQSAVLIPLVEIEGEAHILFEVRSMQLRRQPGDICFPGGRMDPEDASPMDCAIRETTEELGIHYDQITDVTPIDYVVADMGRIIYPYVGRITNINQIAPNESEVGEVFYVPISYLKQTKPESYKVNVEVIPEENFPFDLIVGGEKYNWQTRHFEELFYRYQDKVIWGLTAKILNHFLYVADCREE
ncbi:CoA pyrophosphatase [Ornithinibacillus sp. BX22]|uniref:CoA pyrophosphatase n=2 Tax=Ornithinibacillus TaxID=484508 RepID=A0A923L2T2_9BACI|nr:CoA pyrophosphatase [Ornithinibacillus hominis]MBS3679054.1 CoA pyrophosphatase [Ornithinibacillus massiliensis]